MKAAVDLVVDIERLRIVEVPRSPWGTHPLSAEILVVGGGLGGVAAALAACEAGRRVCLAEETSWLGGQATSQGVSALDENAHVETTGSTRSYQAFRRGIRDWYRCHTRLKHTAATSERLNPGRGWVSRLCFEPKAALAVIDTMLAPHVRAGRLRVLKRCKAYAVGKSGSRVEHVDLVNLETAERYRCRPSFVIDASELGDLPALGAADFVTGAESKTRTAEPAAAEINDPEDVQSFTYTFAIEHCPGERHLIAKPAGYDANLTRQPYTLTLTYHNRGDLRYGAFAHLPGTPGSFWTYRRLIDAGQFDDPAYSHDIAMINWPGNDYRGGSILADSPAEVIGQLRAAKDLSLGLLYWLQNDVDRDDGGKGYPEFKLRPDVMGSGDGLSKFPYIRESRRIVAIKTILEQEVTTAGPRAAHFRDSVGIGFYSIDLHESKRNRKQLINPSRPFQIPLGALIPQSATNVLAACKNIGTTHITNGCYRLHPIEWNIGESAGTTAAMCAERGLSPARLRDDPDLLLCLQRRLVKRGVPIMWYDDVPPRDERFERVQMLPFERPEILARLGGGLHAP